MQRRLHAHRTPRHADRSRRFSRCAGSTTALIFGVLIAGTPAWAVVGGDPAEGAIGQSLVMVLAEGGGACSGVVVAPPVLDGRPLPAEAKADPHLRALARCTGGCSAFDRAFGERGASRLCAGCSRHAPSVRRSCPHSPAGTLAGAVHPRPARHGPGAGRGRNRRRRRGRTCARGGRELIGQAAQRIRAGHRALRARRHPLWAAPPNGHGSWSLRRRFRRRDAAGWKARSSPSSPSPRDRGVPSRQVDPRRASCPATRLYRRDTRPMGESARWTDR